MTKKTLTLIAIAWWDEIGVFIKTNTFLNPPRSHESINYACRGRRDKSLARSKLHQHWQLLMIYTRSNATRFGGRPKESFPRYPLNPSPAMSCRDLIAKSLKLSIPLLTTHDRALIIKRNKILPTFNSSGSREIIVLEFYNCNYKTIRMPEGSPGDMLIVRSSDWDRFLLTLINQYLDPNQDLSEGRWNIYSSCPGVYFPVAVTFFRLTLSRISFSLTNNV
jgi:hypothetical protein